MQYVRAAHIQPLGRWVDASEQTMWFSKAEAETLDVRRDDVLVVEGGAGFGRSLCVAQDMPSWGFQNSIIRVRPQGGRAAGRFIAYALQSALDVGRIAVDCSVATIPHFTAEKVAAFRVPAPCVEEQRRIADLLDMETAKIDALIAKEREVAEAVQTYRQQLITRTVTRGTEEQGERCWARLPLRRDLDFVTSGSRGWAEFYSDDGDRFVRISNLGRRTLSLSSDEVQRVTIPQAGEGTRTVLRVGDVLFSITAYLGSVAVVEPEWEGAYVSQHVGLVRLRRRIWEPRYVGYVGLSDLGQRQLNEGAYGGTKLQLSLDDLREFEAPCPPIPVQRHITAFLDRRLGQLDHVAQRASALSEVLRERRAALITAAVAGQFDVPTYSGAI